MSNDALPDSAAVLTATREWLEKAVIGLNLCPFANAVHVSNRIRYVVSAARTEEALLADLKAELQFLQAAPREQAETTLLIHPGVLNDFLDFNEFHNAAEALLEELRLVGEIQIASFHPDFQFADTEPDDITNFTNRSPYPILHLLREVSLDEAVDAYPEPDRIYEANIETMRRLGPEGLRKLGFKA